MSNRYALKKEHKTIMMMAAVLIAVTAVISSPNMVVYATETNGLTTAIKNTGIEVFNAIVGVASVIAGAAAAFALVQLLVVQNPQRIDRAKTWLIRIIIVFVLLNGIGTVLAFLQNNLADSMDNNIGNVSVKQAGGA